jgi:hypothetical protein
MNARAVAKWRDETDLEIMECLARYHMLLVEHFGLTYRVNITRLIMDINAHPNPRSELCRITELLGGFINKLEHGTYVVAKDGAGIVLAYPRLRLVPKEPAPPPDDDDGGDHD